MVVASVEEGSKDEDSRARTILESVTDAFFSLDRHFRFSYLNRTAVRLLGRDDLIGKCLWDEFPAGRGTRFEEAYERAMYHGERVDFVEHYPAPLDRWYAVRAYPSPDGLSVYFQDVTDQRNAEEAYRRSRDQLELVIRGADVGVWYCPLPFDVLIWDDKVKEHFFLPPDATVTIDTFYERLHPNDREPTRAAIAQSVEERGHYDIEYRTVSPDGRNTRWIHAVGRAFYAENGKPIRFDGITIDISDRKNAEKRAGREVERMMDAERAARAEAERQGRMKDEFLATLSHELRTPLNAVLGWSQILLARGDASTARGLEIIARNARAQTRIIDDLLDMSRMLSGKLRLELAMVDIAAVIEAAVDTARPPADAKGVSVTVDLGAARDAKVRGDPNRLQQVLWNLLTNAIKFSSPGGRVKVSTDRSDAIVEIHVEDDGEGISSAFLPFVFDRFRQADGSTTRRHGGLGLGLSIVKQVVELHGGTVSASSDGLSKGSRFTVSLPRPSSDRPTESEPPATRRITQRQLPALGVDLHGLSVLVVEDEPDSRLLLARLLEDRGARATQATDVTQAIELLQGGAFDVLVSDIGMPGEDGYDLMRRVRQLGLARPIPAIAVTAYTRPEDRLRAISAGFLMHVAKPVEADELVAMVAAAAGRL
jgi:PAS domain S-box-containing protein